MRKTWSPPGPLRRALTGIATTVVEGPVGTSTRTEAPGAGAWLWIRARTSALRVAGSTRASTATIRAVMGRGLGLPQDLEARQRRCRQVGLGLLCLELRFLHGDVERDEHCAGVDDASGREHHLADRP